MIMKSGKLGKLKMPSKDAIDVSELEMDMGPEDGAEVAEEADMDMGMDMESESKGGDILTDIADEDLLAEVKKRGLTAQLGEDEEESESDEYL
jgi:hypothetical protein